VNTRADLLQRRWQELAPLFDQAFELQGAARDAFLAAISDPELQAALRILLADAATDRLDAGSGSYAAEFVGIEPGLEGCLLGPWRVGRAIGAGGMASVFLAERDDGSYAQQVAIKILRFGLHEAAERARFMHERAILARLDHPHIAHLLDGGFTAAGVPWFALEYVDGTPLTTHCDAARLGVEARLRLFADVCAAVDYAHRNLIVHRDLKPANILVRRDGALKLLDFGIAKLIGNEGTAATRTGLRRLTPAYAAPEQHDGGSVTTATDVYALGVVLHELLTGSLPIWHGDGSLVPPSHALTGPVAATRAELQGTPARALRRRIAGDLDLILAKALQPDPAQRYAGAAELAADLERHRHGRPLRARASSRRYRLGRFVRRHRVGIAVGVAFALAILGGIAATLWQAGAARREAARAGAARDFVLSLFDGVTPDESKGREVSARELLDRGSARLAETLAAQPALEGELSTALAGAYRQLGDYARATALAERGVASASDSHARTAARVERARIRAAQGQWTEAERDLRDAAAEAPAQRDTIGLRLAEVLSEEGQLKEAQQLLETIADDGATDAETLLLARAALGAVQFRRGDLDAAASTLDSALAARRDRDGELHTRTATIAQDLGVVLLQQGKAQQAAALFGQALATRRVLLGPRHPDVADSQLNLGTALRRLGDQAGAAREIEAAVAMQRDLLGDTHPAVANGLNSLAMSALQQGDLATAITRFRSAHDAARAAYGESHLMVATMLNNLAGTERAAGRLDDAERDAREAVAVATAAVGGEHYLAGVARMGLGSTLADSGQTEAALPELQTAHATLTAALGATHQDTLTAQGALAAALLQHGDTAAARSAAQAALTAAETAFPAGHPRLGKLRLIAARAAAADHACPTALAALARAEPELASAGATADIDRAWLALTRAECLARTGDASANEAIGAASAAVSTLPFAPPELLRVSRTLPAKH